MLRNLAVKIKPHELVVFSYLIFVSLWNINSSLKSLNFIFFWLGGMLGFSLIEVAEKFMNLRISPFRSVFFQVVFTFLSFYILTSTTSFFGKGVVLTVFLRILCWQFEEWRNSGNLNIWFNEAKSSANILKQGVYYIGMVVFFALETFFLI